jgi:hypothetical protein
MVDMVVCSVDLSYKCFMNPFGKALLNGSFVLM